MVPEENVLAVILRLLAAVIVMLFTCSAVGALQKPRETDPSLDLARFLDGERLAQKLPGLAAVLVLTDGPPRVYVSGERRIGKGDLIAPTDRMHLGSPTKAITVTVIGALVEKTADDARAAASSAPSDEHAGDERGANRRQDRSVDERAREESECHTMDAAIDHAPEKVLFGAHHRQRTVSSRGRPA